MSDPDDVLPAAKPTRVEALGCWLWDHLTVLSIAVVVVGGAAYVALDDAAIPVVVVSIVVFVVGFLVAGWGDARRDVRLGRAPILLYLVPEARERLVRHSMETGCSKRELFRRAMALHIYMWEHRDDPDDLLVNLFLADNEHVKQLVAGRWDPEDLPERWPADTDSHGGGR